MTRRLISWLLLALPAFSAEREFFFIQLSDPQFGMYSGNRGFEQETANLEFAVATVNRLKPAFVIVTGDLVNSPGNLEQIAEYQRIMKKVDPAIPVYNLPGNHDVGLNPTPGALQEYRKHFGRDYYSFRQGPIYGIVLNSCLIFAPEKAESEYEAQMQWLRAELEKAKSSGASQILVFQHHPYFLKDVHEKDAYENIPLSRRLAYLDLLRAAGVRYVFTGHYHQNALAKHQDMEIVVTGPVGKPLRGARSGLRIVKVTPEGLEHKYYEFGDLPVKP